jgi:hypothetical protein
MDPQALPHDTLCDNDVASEHAEALVENDIPTDLPFTAAAPRATKPANPCGSVRLSRVVSIVIARLQDLNRQLGAGLIDIANIVVPRRSQSAPSQKSPKTEPEQWTRLQTVLQDMGFEVELDMLKSLATVHNDNVDAMVLDVVEMYPSESE